MMATPVNVVSSGGTPVTESSFGTPITEGLPGRGTPVTVVSSGGFPVVFVDAPPPTIIAAGMEDDGETVRLSFSDILNPDEVPDLEDFSINDEGGGIVGPPVALAFDGDDLLLSVGTTIDPGDTVTVSYVPGTTPLEGLTGSPVPAFTDYPVENP